MSEQSPEMIAERQLAATLTIGILAHGQVLRDVPSITIAAEETVKVFKAVLREIQKGNPRRAQSNPQPS